MLCAKFAFVFALAASTYDLPHALLPAVAWTESRCKTNAYSHAGAVGIMQIVPRWHPEVNPLDPEASILYAGKYLRRLYDRFGSWELALAAYNAGPTAVARYGGVPPYAETRNYVKQITELCNE